MPTLTGAVFRFLRLLFIDQMIALQPTPYWSVTVENGISRPILVSLESTKLREQPWRAPCC